MTKEQIIKENEKLKNKLKRMQRKLNDATSEVERLTGIVTGYENAEKRKEERKALAKRTCGHCHDRRATCTDHNGRPMCKQCFDLMARAFAHGW